MPITRAQARQLTTDTEQKLVDESFHPQVRELTEAELRRRIDRTRRLRDKYQDLGRRQHKSTKRGQAAAGRPRETANLRTDRKVTLLTQTLERFEKRLSGLQAQEAAAEKAKARSGSARKGSAKTDTEGGSKPPSKKRRGTGGAAGAGVVAPTRREKVVQTRGQSVHGHTKARGRRSQARRDAR